LTPEAQDRTHRSLYETTAWILLSALALIMLSNYLTGALLPAFQSSDSDFAELYASSWLWRQGGNPYDSSLATAALRQVAGGSRPVFLVNIPSSLVLVAPFTYLPWGWANFLFVVLGLAGLVVTILFVLRLQGPLRWGLDAMLSIVFILSFSPLRIAFQWGNVILLVLPLAILVMALAERKQDLQAGILLGLAVCLKPQIGFWLFVYYLLRTRFKIVGASLGTCLAVAAAFFLRPIPFSSLISSYRANMHYWFAPGGPYGITEGSVTWLALRTQTVFYWITHSPAAADWMANLLFLFGAAAWAIFILRRGSRIPSSLSISALWALSFVSLYHSLPDVSVFTLALGDAFPHSRTNWTRLQKSVCGLLFVMMLPERSIFLFLQHHVSKAIHTSWWWDLFLTRYLVWVVLALSLALLLRMREVQRGSSEAVRPD
jgi:hypothetical protein